jgi:TolB protein
VYALQPDGGSVQKLTDIASVESGPGEGFLDLIGHPAWSHNGQRIAFTCVGSNGFSAICVSEPDGSPGFIVTEPIQGDSFPAWGPDGRIAFTRYIGNEESQIGVVEPDGSGLRILTRGHDDADPSWSPDGQTIVFSRRLGDQHDLFVFDLEAGVERTLTETAELSEAGATFSPEGDRIAFVQAGAGAQDVWTMSTTGTGERRVTRGMRYVLWPTWGPDGRRLAFMCEEQGICVVNADGSSPRMIYRGPDLTMHPAWNPI